MCDSVKRMLFEAEKSLFDNEKLNDSSWVDCVVHDDFMEITSTGSVTRKENVLKNIEHCHRPISFHVNNFDYIQLTDTSWVIYYIVAYGDVKQYHSSVWVRDDSADRLQIIFHQVSNLEKEVELVPFE